MKRYSIIAIVALLISMSFFIFIQKVKVQNRDRAERDARGELQAKTNEDIKKRIGQPDESGADLAKKPDVPQFKGLTPDEAKRQMEEANRTTNITEKSKACSAIIENLCKSGYPEEAWDLIE